MSKFTDGLIIARWWLQESGQSISDEEIQKYFPESEVEAWGEVYKYTDAHDVLKSFQKFAKNPESKGIANIGRAVSGAAMEAAGSFVGLSGYWNAAKSTAGDLIIRTGNVAEKIGGAAVSGATNLLKFLPVVVTIALIGIILIYMPKISRKEIKV